ncbi:MAG: nucleoside phosphorylase [Infirmifilum sp.]|jgi:uridine phosphorylase|uniref:nucleoside phosphorylase n=1 Tax=Infirmifilum TaxID=2856573 RepID=UPI00069A33B5|nr:nucleoside phosphorylase [Infirmifilum uzonense]
MPGDAQYHIRCRKGDVGKYVILPGDPGRVPLIARHLENAVKIAQNREYVTYTGYWKGIRVSVTSTGIGSPAATIAVEELANVGAEVFIRLGTCGGVEPSVHAGDIIVAQAAVRGEGASKEYLPTEYPAVADHDVVEALLRSSRKLGIPVKTGIVWTHDAYYRGTWVGEMPPQARRVYEPWLEGGVLCVENEVSGIYVVSRIRRKKAGAVLLCMGNNLVETPEQFTDTDYLSGVERMTRLVLGAIELLEEGLR